MQQPPPASFDPIVTAEEDRGEYIARKIVFNVTADSRIPGYLLIPKGKGPFPAVLLLNDHGARFDIGKEKVIEPFNDTTQRRSSAEEWVKRTYDGKFICNELAKRGYVCFAMDALNWSDRGGAGYEGQQALASNLLNLGMSYAGLIAWEDLYAAEFIATRAEVDSSRIAAVGVSMGAFRAWQLAALSDRIAGCVAVCWMATRTGLIVPGGNLTRGQSSFTTTHPNLANFLDYPDIASIACPKPMLFFNGLQDRLFPVSSVEAAYAKMHEVWNSQNADEQLETKLWNAGHVFNQKMQEEAFLWLDRHFRNMKPH
jgi:dienelactone hydrolase